MTLDEAIFCATCVALPLREELHEPLQAMLHGAVMDFISGNDVYNLSRNVKGGLVAHW